MAGWIFVTLFVACSAPVDDAGTPRRIARQVDQLMMSVAETELAADPELATRLGLSEDRVGYDFNTYLTDRSQAAYERMRLTRLEVLEKLLSAPRPAEGGKQARHLDTVIHAYETAEDLFVAGHGQTGLGYAYPYVADHMRGAYIDVPELMTRAHPVRTARDARDYVARLAQFADTLQDERRRLEADARSGIVPPVFILERMQAQTRELGAGPASEHILVTTLQNLLSGPEDLTFEEQQALADKALALVETEILPAYADFEAALNRIKEFAPEDPGVWQVPEGDAYYDAALQAYTDPGITAETLHSQGQAEVERLTQALMARRPDSDAGPDL